jgi:hypothetical protein
MIKSLFFKRVWLLALLAITIIDSYLLLKYLYPPIPNNLSQTLFEGIDYIREVRHTPRPIIIHLVLIDLTNPNLQFLVTPTDSVNNGKIGARTTSQFLAEFNLQLAVNGNFFYPFHPLYSVDFWNAYPNKPGDLVQVVGFASSRGQVYSPSNDRFETLYISEQNQAQFQTPIGDVYNAISGKPLLVFKGVNQGPFSGNFAAIPYPRTALALDKAAKTLMIFAADGKQRNYSDGVTLMELAEIIQHYGGYTALNLDGGGSSTLVMEGPEKTPILLNSPINGRIRGNERLIANHLGIFVRNRQ